MAKKKLTKNEKIQKSAQRKIGKIAGTGTRQTRTKNINTVVGKAMKRMHY